MRRPSAFICHGTSKPEASPDMSTPCPRLRRHWAQYRTACPIEAAELVKDAIAFATTTEYLRGWYQLSRPFASPSKRARGGRNEREWAETAALIAYATHFNPNRRSSGWPPSSATSTSRLHGGRRTQQSAQAGGISRAARRASVAVSRQTRRCECSICTIAKPGLESLRQRGGSTLHGVPALTRILRSRRARGSRLAAT